MSLPFTPNTDWKQTHDQSKALKQRSPNSGIYCPMIWGGADVIIIEINVNVKPLNHPETIPHPWSMEKCLPKNQFLVPKRLGTSGLKDFPISYPRNTAEIKRQSSWNHWDREIYFLKNLNYPFEGRSHFLELETQESISNYFISL